MGKGENTAVSTAQLRQLLVRYFNESELQDLAYDLGVDYENLSGSAKNDKVRALIDHLQRRDRLVELIILCEHHRSNIPWVDVYNQSQSETLDSMQDEPIPSQFQDNFSCYEAGLVKLMDHFEKHSHDYAEALVYQQRLVENLAQTRRYGDTEARRAERSETIDRLNGLAMPLIGISFNQLCNKAMRDLPI